MVQYCYGLPHTTVSCVVISQTVAYVGDRSRDLLVLIILQPWQTRPKNQLFILIQIQKDLLVPIVFDMLTGPLPLRNNSEEYMLVKYTHICSIDIIKLYSVHINCRSCMCFALC